MNVVNKRNLVLIASAQNHPYNDKYDDGAEAAAT